jgi:hypothetical protein
MEKQDWKYDQVTMDGWMDVCSAGGRRETRIYGRRFKRGRTGAGLEFHFWTATDERRVKLSVRCVNV